MLGQQLGRMIDGTIFIPRPATQRMITVFRLPSPSLFAAV